MKRAVEGYLIILILLCVPGCGKVVDWGKSNFYQGHEYDTYRAMTESYIKSVTLYDQLTTSAHFDVIWLSDQVRTAYADLHGARLAKSTELKDAFLRRQLEENDHFISFYALSIYEVKLGIPESHWSLSLEVDGKTYQPLEIKVVDLPYEYQVFFGTYFNRFKEPYQVRFSARDFEDNLIITPETKEIKLHVRSATKGYTFTWPVVQEEMSDEEVMQEPPVEKPVPKRKRGRKQRVEKEVKNVEQPKPSAHKRRRKK